ncbi:HAD family hydrolase [Schleiferilactobacillus perolens]|uniref:HAD superfamily hydrolase n=1 Tax=Schleiferilactobacillus perolens DSM 12744 TaxID=1423792 RepID=A0A0R1NCG5_9LACO|nr:HAD family hydrolase [Schleiferilactobacillus perolens]KRL14507.1 HAD superfamily hydrolase [Schleiferilactobacillus perolens DSM 12744]
MAPYYIFMDIDGTLVDDNQQASPATINTIDLLHQQGHRLFIATGRMLASASLIANQISPYLEIVASNGAVVKTSSGVEKKLLGAAALHDIYQVGQATNLSAFLFTTQRVFYTKNLPSYFTQDTQNRVTGTGQQRFVHIDSAEALVKHRKSIVNGILISDNAPKELKHARAALTSLGTLSTSSSAPNNIELMPYQTDKATAIRRICEENQHSLDRTMAFGDGLNDLAMLQAVNVGVAMGNAATTVKNAVPYLTHDNSHDGVATFLNHYFGGQQ